MPIITKPSNLNFRRYNAYIRFKMDECQKKFPNKSIKIFTCIYPVDEEELKPLNTTNTRSFSDPNPPRRLKRYIAKGPKTEIRKIREKLKDHKLIRNDPDEIVVERPLIVKEEDVCSYYSGEVDADVQVIDKLPMIKMVEYQRTNYLGCCFFNEEIRVSLDEITSLENREVIHRKGLETLLNDLKIEISYQKKRMNELAIIEDGKIDELKKQQDETKIVLEESKDVIIQAKKFIQERLTLIQDLNTQIDRISTLVKENNIFLGSFKDVKYWKRNDYQSGDDLSDISD